MRCPDLDTLPWPKGRVCRGKPSWQEDTRESGQESPDKDLSPEGPGPGIDACSAPSIRTPILHLTQFCTPSPPQVRGLHISKGHRLSQDIVSRDVAWLGNSLVAPSQDWTRCLHGGPSHKNVPVEDQALRLPGVELEVGAQGPCGLPLACPMPTSPLLPAAGAP